MVERYALLSRRAKLEVDEDARRPATKKGSENDPRRSEPTSHLFLLVHAKLVPFFAASA